MDSAHPVDTDINIKLLALVNFTMMKPVDLAKKAF